jgi:dihydroorotate dehydrogenase electron transfer subunit
VPRTFCVLGVLRPQRREIAPRSYRRALPRNGLARRRQAAARGRSSRSILPDMPVDVDAEVIANTRLSEDYNVLALAAPEIARQTRPGQFVMVKPARGLEPLLRRPFSVFEVLRDGGGAPIGITILNKRIGVGTGLLYALDAGDRLACLGPLGRPFTPVPADAEAWLVAGGVGLAPFATMAETLRANNIPTTLFYGARRGSDLYYADWFADRGVRVETSTEDGSAGDRGFVTAPLERALTARASDAGGDSGDGNDDNKSSGGDNGGSRSTNGSRSARGSNTGGDSGGRTIAIYVCGPTPMMRAVCTLAARYGCDAEVSLEQTMGCGMGGCYSCVVRIKEEGHTPHFVRSCLAGPTFRGRDIVWEELAH